MDGCIISQKFNYTYDENLANKMVNDIMNVYFPELKKMHDKLEKEVQFMYGLLDKDLTYMLKALVNDDDLYRRCGFQGLKANPIVRIGF